MQVMGWIRVFLGDTRTNKPAPSGLKKKLRSGNGLKDWAGLSIYHGD